MREVSRPEACEFSAKKLQPRSVRRRLIVRTSRSHESCRGSSQEYTLRGDNLATCRIIVEDRHTSKLGRHSFISFPITWDVEQEVTMVFFGHKVGAFPSSGQTRTQSMRESPCETQALSNVGVSSFFDSQETCGSIGTCSKTSQVSSDQNVPSPQLDEQPQLFQDVVMAVALNHPMISAVSPLHLVYALRFHQI